MRSLNQITKYVKDSHIEIRQQLEELKDELGIVSDTATVRFCINNTHKFCFKEANKR